MDTAPGAAPAGETNTTDVEDCSCTVAARPASVTEVMSLPLPRLAPVSVSVRPPSSGPLLSERAENVIAVFKKRRSLALIEEGNCDGYLG